MLIADLKGKLTLHEHISEDFLTSSVFSVLKYLGGGWLKRFLSCAVNLAGERFPLPMIEPVYEFWPWFSNDREYGNGAAPDVVIYAQDTAAIIEAKNYSGKSGEGVIEGEAEEGQQTPKQLADQLAREYFVGSHRILGSRRHGATVRCFCLVFLTRHRAMPKDDLDRTMVAIRTIRAEEAEPARRRTFWLSWSHLIPILEEAASSYPERSCQRLLVEDLSEFLEKRDIGMFSGFTRAVQLDALASLRLGIRDTVFYQAERRRFWLWLERASVLRVPSPVFYQDRRRVYWDFLDGKTVFRIPGEVFYRRR